MTNQINTSGGASIDGNVNIEDGNFINKNFTFNIITADAKELVQNLLGASLKGRRDQWMNEVGKAVVDLHKHTGITVEELQANDAFIDTVLQASQLALKTSKQEKREALRNAITNSVLPDAPEEILQHRFLNWIDEFSVWHIRVLKLLAGSEEFTKKILANANSKDVYTYRRLSTRGTSNERDGINVYIGDGFLASVLRPERTVKLCYQEITNYADVLVQDLVDNKLMFASISSSILEQLAKAVGIWKSIDSKGDKIFYLDETEDLNTLLTRKNQLDTLTKFKWTTELGDQFLKFIESPFN